MAHENSSQFRAEVYSSGFNSLIADSLSTDLRENLMFKHGEARPTTLRYHECPHDPANHEQNSYDHFGSTQISVLTLFRKP